MGLLGDVRENVASTWETVRGDDIEIENLDTGDSRELTRRKVLVSAISTIGAWEGLKRTPGATERAVGGLSSSIDSLDDNYATDIKEIETSEGELHYTIDFEASDQAIYDIVVNNTNVRRANLNGEITEEGVINILDPESGNIEVGAGISPKGQEPSDNTEISDHRSYETETVYIGSDSDETDEPSNPDYADDICDIHRELNRNQQRSFEGELRTAEEIRGVDLDDIELYSKGDRIYLDDSSTKTGDIQLNGQKRDTDELSLPDRYAERMLEAYEEDRGGFYEGLDDIASGNCK